MRKKKQNEPVCMYVCVFRIKYLISQPFDGKKKEYILKITLITNQRSTTQTTTTTTTYNG